MDGGVTRGQISSPDEWAVCLPIDRSPSASPFAINRTFAAPFPLLPRCPPCSCGLLEKEKVEERWNINQSSEEKWQWWNEPAGMMLLSSANGDDCSWACKLLPGVSSGVTVDTQPGFISRTWHRLIMTMWTSKLGKFITFKWPNRQ